MGHSCFLPPIESGNKPQKAGEFEQEWGVLVSWYLGCLSAFLIFRTSCAAGTTPRMLWEGEPAFAHLSISSDEAKIINRSTVRASTNQREIKTPFRQVLDMSVLILFSDRVLTCHATYIIIN